MLIDDFRKLNETFEAALVPSVYAPDAILDSNVPEWRFQRKGADEIANQYREWAGDVSDLTVSGFTAHETPWGFVVELEQRYRAEDDDCLSRQMHLLKVRDGRIVEQTMYCTGVWSSETVKRQAAEAPMVQ